MKRLLNAMVLVLSVSIAPAWSQVTSLDEKAQQQLDEIVAMLRDHPGLIPSLHSNLQQFIVQQQAREEARKKHHSWLFEDSAHPRLGPKQSDKTLVVFTDYNCPYCKQLEPALQKLHAEYPDLAIVNIYVPLRQRGAPGMATGSAQYALNVWREQPDAFDAVNELLFKKNGMHDRQSLTQIAQRTKTTALLNQDSAADHVVKRNLEAFKALGLRGTPSVLIGDELVPGYIPYEQLQQIVAQQFKL